MSFADSSTASVGQHVVTVGNAGGVGGTPSAVAGSIVALNQPITALDGRAITSASGLTDALELHHPGDRVRVTRQDMYGSQHTATVPLITGPAD